MRKTEWMLALAMIVSCSGNLPAASRFFAGSSLDLAFSYLHETNATGNVRARLLSNVSSDGNKIGDVVTARVLSPEALAGGLLEGTVKLCKKGGKLNGDAALMFSFEKLTFEGQTWPIKSIVASVLSGHKEFDIAPEGILISSNHTPEIGAVAGLSGAMIGGVAGGWKWFGIGAGIGAGSGLGVQLVSKAPVVFLAKGTEILLAVD